MPRTDALVVYESQWGRTQTLAEVVAGVLAAEPGTHVSCVPLHIATPHAVEHAPLVVVGAPTRVPARPNPAVVIADVISDALRAWLDRLPPGFGRAAAVFDTRPSLLRSGAADVVSARMQDEGYELVRPAASFLVDGPVGSLPPEQRARARAWALRLPVARPALTPRWS